MQAVRVALKAAQESISLLKNENSVLPLGPSVHSIAVVGPLAESTYLGGYANKNGKGIAILEGLKQRAGSSLDIKYEKGYSSDTSGAAQNALLQKAISTVNNTDVALVVLGEDIKEIGEGKDRSDLDLNQQQKPAY